MTYTHSSYYEVLLMLGGALLAAPLFKRLGLGTILGYLAAGVVIGPLLHQIRDGEELLHVAELGVVFLLFLIGLELKPSRLWAMRRDIFGVGAAQVAVTGTGLAGLALLTGLVDWAGALIVGFGLALSSTAFALQILDENGDTNTRYGQRAFSLLLFQDLAIVPLLAVIPLLAHQSPEDPTTALEDFAVAVGAITALLVAGRYLLNPLFQVIARTGAREAMIAAALFVVLAAANLLQMAGLSMAMGAFLAGVLLADSSYRHELQADVEPFRGILLGLFFMAVGLSLHIDVIFSGWPVILIATPAMMLAKSLIIYGLSRLTGSPHNDAVRIALLLPQGGEFGFVLFTAAAAAGIFSGSTASLLVAIVTVSMALTPISAALARFFLTEEAAEEMDEDFDGAGADVLMIGFSRFGQIAAQILLAGGREVTVIDHSTERVRQAASFGFRIYFGDGTRKDVLLAAGIERAKIVAICTHSKATTDRIVDLVRTEYPNADLFVRSYDRIHTLSLRERGVQYEIRETLESGLLFGRKVLEALGLGENNSLDIADDIRDRDEARLQLQAVEGLSAGRDMLHTKPVKPEPLLKPKRKTEDAGDETVEA
ncbi:monovalent cation:proton antiporter-2 (CPA2) family protein [Shinella daejeonensis]|uniref:monovalent cation:proton antiporter-2 (CPA2) family protein n=1 Tax=Shinella daejeonensis TaxID=659017 RepID=UPI0020C7565D|nr:monovalent cation:proton antiporter-2 (CPA2) family protein [Shinella daejeonensis]MCP8897493.1 monovalent cation:proton antiporter-2 (CPA2) family protein [Shinella daejeonensis]